MTSSLANPFLIYDYRGPELFCDRESELSSLLEAFSNRRYVMLYSMRRLGKTGLIHHFHHILKKRRKGMCIYVDVQNTMNDEAFVAKLISASITTVEKSRKQIVSRLGNFFSNLRPSITFDPVTNIPSIEIQIKDAQQIQQTLNVLIRMLNSLGKQVQISIDEFQQISNYEIPSIIDATLRGYLHKMPNIHFLFSGSQRRLLSDLFTKPQKPFYHAVDQLKLAKLDPQIYGEFIAKNFADRRQKISQEFVDEILDWTEGHTFYTQYFCNRLFAKKNRTIVLTEVEQVKKEILFSYEPNYLQLRAALSNNQWHLLSAIAHEKKVASVNEKEFLNRYKMAQSSAAQALRALLDKELLYEELGKDNKEIFVYDPYLANWLRKFT